MKYYNENENACLVRIDFDNQKAWAKYEEKEFPIKFKSETVDLAIMHGEHITKEVYDKGKVLATK